MECELTGIVVVAFLHLGVVLADIGLEEIAVCSEVGILKSAEHCVGLWVSSLSLNSCLAVTCTTVCVVNSDVRIELIELCDGNVIVCLAHGCVKNEVTGSASFLLRSSLCEDGCHCNQSDKQNC